MSDSQSEDQEGEDLIQQLDIEKLAEEDNDEAAIVAVRSELSSVEEVPEEDNDS